ncbi:VOC family protein [Paenibacillus sp. FSL R7-0179]|uniref:VOC family protein n=1 Tax=Paenibacillus sp. FSL R7-0179 TaxID=2921672 RepID=UPI0030F869D8
MKIDHLVVNVDASVQEDKQVIRQIEAMGLPYKPKWGKGTRGFKVSNLWIGREYFELVRIKTRDGGGWISEWTTRYLKGHRGLVGFALEVDDIDATYQRLKALNIEITAPEPLRFRWFFNLLTRTMPWRNSYLPAFKGVPFQFFLQQMNDEKSRHFMEQYMVPNSRENDIVGIAEVTVEGTLTLEDLEIIHALFPDCEQQGDTLNIHLGSQVIRFRESGTSTYGVEVLMDCNRAEHAGKTMRVGDLQIRNSE